MKYYDMNLKLQICKFYEVIYTEVVNVNGLGQAQRQPHLKLKEDGSSANQPSSSGVSSKNSIYIYLSIYKLNRK